MGLKAAIQALKKAEILKEKVQNSRDLLNDNEAWICQQQLQRIYQQVLILDLEYALDRKVEQELWNHGFKNYIGTLQNLAKDKKNPKRSESQAMLSWCLEAASGFYLTLLQEICTAFDLDLPFRRKSCTYTNGKLLRNVSHLNQPHKSSCYYICQHCLVHLGDIARYRNQNRQAEAFYRHAVQLSPSSGQPYNQLALLEASRGDRLSTVFHYVRSVAVRHLFPAAATNLARTFQKSSEDMLNVEVRPKLSTHEYIALFLKVHGLLYSATDLQQAERYVKVLVTTLTAHVATESLTSWKLVQMLAINLFMRGHAGGALSGDRHTFSDKELAAEEVTIRRLVTDLLAGSLSALLLPVYTLREGDALLDYFALPAIKLTLDWIHLEPHVLNDSAFTTRLQIWPSLCKLLNGLQLAVVDFSADKYSYVPLPEDRDLQGFIPLEKAFSDLRFSCEDWKLEPPQLNKLRACRLIVLGRWLASLEPQPITYNASEDIPFDVVGGQSLLASDVIRELEELSLEKLPSPAPSESSSWGTGASTPDNNLADGDGGEKRIGILKPQGSLEKAREKEVETGPGRRGRQNVAMQAIMRQSTLSGDQDAKPSKVTFKTPSPSFSPASSQSTEDGSKPPAWPQEAPSANPFTGHAPVFDGGGNSLGLGGLLTPSFSQAPPSFTSVPPPAPYHIGPPPHSSPATNLPISESFSFTPWRDEAPPMPPQSWWSNGDSSTFHQHAQRMMVPPPLDVGAGDVFTGGWNSRQPFMMQQPSNAAFQGAPQRRDPNNTSMYGANPCSPEGTAASRGGEGVPAYSLFSTPSWAGSGACGLDLERNTGLGGLPELPGSVSQQSLWSGPGPSPLERLLEQQKQLREGPAPKGGT